MATEIKKESPKDLDTEIIPAGIKAFLILARQNGFASGEPAKKDPLTVNLFIN